MNGKRVTEETMDVSLFSYDLPQELIAQFPQKRRDASRLMVLNRSGGPLQHRRFSNFPDYLEPGDALVVNNTKVFKARLIGHRQTGGKVEVFLVRAIPDRPEVWVALVMPGRRVKEGEEIRFGGRRHLRLLKRQPDASWLVEFSSPAARDRIISAHGHVPLPHYVNRTDQPSDIRRYQTVYARKDRTGAVAAPTAGFHFTRPLLEKLKSTGTEIIELTLHVGPGTFRPIKAADIDEHVVDPEWAELSGEAARSINRVRESGRSLFVVGTTSVRTLESAPIKGGYIQPFNGMVDLYIKPGHSFQWVDHLITNFHLPKSSLLVLVAALTGREQILAAYAEAVSRHYRFYSYGDAMLIL